MINLLKHALILPDGHRRYAREHNISFAEAYKLGWQNALKFARYLFDQGLEEVTYHGIYSYNFTRREQDLEDYFDVSLHELEHLSEILHGDGIDFYIHGELDILYERRPEYRAVIEGLPKAIGAKKKFNLLFAYSAEKELQRAITSLIQARLPLDHITYDAIMQKSFSPTPFSIIFTSGQNQYPEQAQSFPFIAQVTPHLRNARICATNKFFPAMSIDDIKVGIEDYRKMYEVISQRIAKGQ